MISRLAPPNSRNKGKENFDITKVLHAYSPHLVLYLLEIYMSSQKIGAHDCYFLDSSGSDHLFTHRKQS